MADPITRMGAPPERPSLSGLTEDEARSFHRMFVTSFIVFVLIAAVAHFAVWQWRPWIPGVSGYPAPATSSAPAAGASATVVAATP